MNKVLIGLLVASIAGNVFLLTKPNGEILNKEIAFEPKVVKEVETITVQDEAAVQDLAKANKKIVELEESLVKLQAKLDLIQEREDFAKLNEEIDANNKKLIDGEVEFDEDMLAKIKAKWKALNDLYTNESVDENWAYKTQDALVKTLNEYSDSSSYNLESLKCKATVCKMTLKPYKQIQNGAVMVGLNVTAGLYASDEFRGFDNHMQLSESDGIHTTDIYIVKKPPKP